MTERVTEILQNISLQSMNTLRLPGRARYFSTFSDLSTLLFLHEEADRAGISLRVLGGGSNVLMTADVKALVIHPVSDRVTEISRNSDTVVVDVDAGKHWHEWVSESIRYGHGLENLALIPGTVGAAPIQNIGAYGVEAGELIDSVTGYQLSTRQLRTLSAAECRFGYRDSVFKRELKDDFVVMRVRFALQTRFNPVLDYAPLNQLERASLTADTLIQNVVEIRSSKLPDPAVTPNAGSYFHNPVVSTELAQALQQQFPGIPLYPQTRGVKLAAGWLIEQCGFKGRALGPVSMYEKQALVLTTQPGATLDDVRCLQQQIQQAVERRFGVWLTPEPGEFG